MKAIQTRKNEEITITSNPREMKNKYLSKPLLTTWIEDFVDEDTGQVVSIERSDKILEKGTHIGRDEIETIMFHLQSGDITNVEVSNQNRMAYELLNEYLLPWMATARIEDKGKKIILYAANLTMAYEIAKDFIELNYKGGFTITGVKALDPCSILKDSLHDESLGTESEEEPKAKEFYQIETTGFVKVNDFPNSCDRPFIIETVDPDRGMMIIKDHILKYANENYRKDPDDIVEVDIKLKTAKIIPCSKIIDKEFSEQYI